MADQYSNKKNSQQKPKVYNVTDDSIQIQQRQPPPQQPKQPKPKQPKPKQQDPPQRQPAPPQKAPVIKPMVNPYIGFSGTMSLGHRLKYLSYQIAIQRDTESKSSEYEKFDDLFGIAHVEGYDDSSYITSSLKDIKRKLSENELDRAATRITRVLEDVMPFDYYQFFELYKATEQTAERLKGKACWVLLGPTGIQFNLVKI